MFLVSAVKTSFLNLIYHGAGTVVHHLLLKFSMVHPFVKGGPRFWLVVNLYISLQESDGKLNGKLPVSRFKEIIEDNPLWESVPPDIQDLIMINVERSGEKFVDFDSFYNLIRGSKFEGFTGWQKKAFRVFVKQTAKNVLPYHYQYQNQVRICCIFVKTVRSMSIMSLPSLITTRTLSALDL